jgi:hypothetical protein
VYACVAITPTPGLACGTLSPTDVEPEATATPISLESGEMAKMENVPVFRFSIKLITSTFYENCLLVYAINVVIDEDYEDWFYR